MLSILGDDITPYLSEIRMMSFNFAPKGHALCNGQLLPINQNQALFSLLGTTYGGDGRVNFGLPNLQERVPMSWGGSHVLGEIGGTAAQSIAVSNLPDHGHSVKATLTQTISSNANVVSPSGAFPAPAPVGSPRYSTSADDRMAIINEGVLAKDLASNQPLATNNNRTTFIPFDNQMPYLTINFIIALQGIFPSQT
ncbi:microcystin-dependent protein [Chitinophaga polysaccharea]|uniref:Microcystin-dependent protein n=1 Tax=Chitinophaga polysaccharea TaxID=1293035 RepID=A0A561PP16_9BACT|nr:tail fiber protein [Chitinophaga polysaccharea]TWF39861.1 microcystin-dependent protein [Chitinophaga polysaccharea]